MHECIILGCGGSHGVPQIGCNCYVCSSDSILNKRTRTSILLKSEDGFNLLVDTSPDFRSQALREGIKNIDAVLYTHYHYDHIAGIGDLKPLVPYGKCIQCFADSYTSKELINSFRYIFSNVNSDYPSWMLLNTFWGAFQINGLSIIPILQYHGNWHSYGFRFGDLAYSTDVLSFPECSYASLSGIKIWLLDCMRYYNSLTHQNLEDMLYAVNRIKPDLTVLIHMSDDIDYYEIKNLLPPNIIPAYDGMRIYFGYGKNSIEVS